MENQIAQYQQIQQQMQMIASQRIQMEAQSKELEKALDILGKSKDDANIYRSVGSILIKADSKENVKKELEEQKEIIDVRVKTLERQESHLRERFQGLQAQLQAAISKQQDGLGAAMAQPQKRPRKASKDDDEESEEEEKGKKDDE